MGPMAMARDERDGTTDQRLTAPAVPETTCVGRDTERAAGAEFLRQIEDGPASFVIEGGVGTGKSLLFTEILATTAPGTRVLSCRPERWEREMSYCAVADLIAPIADEVLGSLPPPQRRAVEAVLLLQASAEGIEARAVAAGFLSVLHLLAASGPVLVAVDDAPWLDPGSAVVLGYAAKRLGSAPVGMLLTATGDCRSGGGLPAPVALPSAHRVQLGPLSLAAIRAIILDRLGEPLARRTLLRVHELSGGNPRFALELAEADRQDGGADGSEARFPHPTKPFDKTLSGRIARLSPAGRSVAMAAAALSHPTIETLCQVAGAHSWAESGGAEVEAAEVFTVRNGVVTFTEPPLAASAYAAATDLERRELHRRLADVAVDPVEQARHLALSSSGPDTDVARRLDQGAGEAHDRSLREAAVELAEAALHLTPLAAGDDRRRRRIASAGYFAAAGDRVMASTRLNEALVGLSPGPERAEVLRRLGVVLLSSNPLGDGRDLLLQARSEAGTDDAIVAAVERDLAIAALSAGAADAAGRHAHAALRATQAAGRDPLITGAAAATVAAALFAGQGVAPGWVAHASHWEAEAGDVFRLEAPLLLSAIPARARDDLDEARSRLELAARSRRPGGDPDLALLCELAGLEAAAGRWSAAAIHADRAVEGFELLDDNVGLARALAARGRVHAATGRVADARADLTRAQDLIAGRGIDMVYVAVAAAFGFLEVTLGDDAAAASRLAPLSRVLQARGMAEAVLLPWIPDCIEAMISAGDAHEAEELLGWYGTVANRHGRAHARACHTRGQALLAARRGDLVNASFLIERATGSSAGLPYPLEHGRNLLIKGLVERRRKLKGEARLSVAQAVEVFEQQGAAAWANRARQELHRLEPSRQGPDGLTPLEMRVAEHVMNRLTAREMAAQLFVSRRTVEGTLGRLYTRYNVHSRAELRAVWLENPPAGLASEVSGGT
jgi:DNA-binding CsgD family transcriptional regulator